ncbi:reverse transcriptase domain-containing protein [Tanacetum coccineum]
MPRILIPLRPILGVLRWYQRQGSPSQDYIPGPRGPPSKGDYVLAMRSQSRHHFTDLHTLLFRCLVYPEFLPVDDAGIPVLRSSQCLLHDSPTHQSPGYNTGNVAYSVTGTIYCLSRRGLGMVIRTQVPDTFISEEDPLQHYNIPPPSHISLTYVEGSLGSGAARIRTMWMLQPVHETEIPEMWLPLCKRLCRTTPGPRCEVGESSAAGAARQFGPTTAEADLYGFADMLEAAPGRQMSRELGYGIRDTWDDLAEDHTILHLMVDTHIALLIEEEARLSRAAWARSMDACDQRTRGEDSVISELAKAEIGGRGRPELSRGGLVGGVLAVLRRCYGCSYCTNMAPREGNKNHGARPVTDLPHPVTTTPPTGHKDLLPTLSGHKCPTAGPMIGTEGVVNLTQWFERMETVFRISNCTVENQVKFAICTLMGTALTWWNSHARTVTKNGTWSDLKKKMTTKYCPRNEIKKIEIELWNLKVQGTDVVAYNQRFQELALLSDRMFPEETDKIERYVGGMPDSIYSSVVASKPKTMQEAIEMATDLMDREDTLWLRRTDRKTRDV